MITALDLDTLTGLRDRALLPRPRRESRVMIDDRTTSGVQPLAGQKVEVGIQVEEGVGEVA
jgi:hypothetical protein